MEPDKSKIELHAGPLEMLFEPGGLRSVRLGDREVLRRVYVGVRDQNWGTIEPRISNLKSEIQADSFRLEFDCEHRQGEIDFRWQGVIIGDASGEIRFSMEGEAHSDFLRNRIGFCVLHPIDECAGQPCEVLHTDGTIEPGRFPHHIAPHQPFLDIRALTHEVLPGVHATVRMEGETFEAEDQRNWTDYSFKTYGTPLALPFPVLMKQGERISQRVTLQLSGVAPKASIQPDEIRLRIEAAPIQTLPKIGLGTASHGKPLSEREIARLRTLRLSHLRVDLNLSQQEFEERLEQAAAESNAMGAGLEAALFLSDAADAELQRLGAVFRKLKPRVLRWLIFHTAEKVPGAHLVKTAAEGLRQLDDSAVIGTGTDAWFTEINRTHPPVQSVDWLCYSISPQTHAIDSLTLMENLAGQAATVQNAKRLFGHLPVAVTPVTLKPRFSASATGPNELPPQVDARQPTLLAAAWTLGSIQHLTESGASSITYYETTGWRGVMELATGAVLPGQFASTPGAVFPLWHVLANVNEFAGGDVLPVAAAGNDVLKIAALALRRNGQTRVMLANLTAQVQKVRLELPSECVRLKRLNEDTQAEATLTPETFRAKPADEILIPGGRLAHTLGPYEIVTLDD